MVAQVLLHLLVRPLQDHEKIRRFHHAQVLLHLLVRPLKTLTLSVSQVNEDGGAGASSSPCTTPAGP